MTKRGKKERTCIRCGQTGDEDSMYCGPCGAPLINRCTDQGGILGNPCGHINKEDASFCTRCGSYTAFYKAGILTTTYSENKALSVDEVKEVDLFNHPFFED